MPSAAVADALACYVEREDSEPKQDEGPKPRHGSSLQSRRCHIKLFRHAHPTVTRLRR
jgi:hypothetical protein